METYLTPNQAALELLRMRTELYHYQALEAADQLQQMLDEQAEQELTEAQARID